MNSITSNLDNSDNFYQTLANPHKISLVFTAIHKNNNLIHFNIHTYICNQTLTYYFSNMCDNYNICEISTLFIITHSHALKLKNNKNIVIIMMIHFCCFLYDIWLNFTWNRITTLMSFIIETTKFTYKCGKMMILHCELREWMRTKLLENIFIFGGIFVRWNDK